MKAVVNGKILTVTGPVYENGAVLIRDGKIAAVGLEINIPAGCSVIDAKGSWVTPGLIDAHTHLMGFPAVDTMPGAADLNEVSDPITPHVRAIDALNPFDDSVALTREAGFTTCYVLPGSANIIGGLGCAVKLRGHTAEEMVIPGSEMMKMALGENPRRVYGSKGKLPTTRMGTAGLLRETLTEALHYSDALRLHEQDKGEKPKFNAKSHALLEVIRGERKCRIHCHRADDIITAIRIAKEYKLDYSLEHVTEGYKVADVLKKENVACVIGPMTLGMVKQEVWGIRLDTPAVLEQSGVNFCLTEDSSAGTQYLPCHIGIAIREGLSEQTALEAVTIRPARLLRLQDRIGSLEAGKDGDIAIFDGNPFHNMTRCVLTMIDGEVCSSRLDKI